MRDAARSLAIESKAAGGINDECMERCVQFWKTFIALWRCTAAARSDIRTNVVAGISSMFLYGNMSKGIPAHSINLICCAGIATVWVLWFDLADFVLFANRQTRAEGRIESTFAFVLSYVHV